MRKPRARLRGFSLSGISDVRHIIKDICETSGRGSKKMRALDFFAGDGRLLSHRVLKGYEVEAWDSREEALSRYVFPEAKKVCGDSFKLARAATERSYDLILIDAPAGPFGDYCEHFEALEAALPLLRDGSTVAFNVFTSPMKYLITQPFHGGSARNTVRRCVNGDLTEWEGRRRRYYGAEFSFLEDYIGWYCSLFKSRGYAVKGYETERRLPGVWLASFSLKRSGA